MMAIKSNSGFLFVFEGYDECGKSTMIKDITDRLRANGYNVQEIHFPGKDSNRLGELVDKIHHKNLEIFNLDISPFVKQMLHVAAHIDLEENVIIPHLKQGGIVLLDRFWLSTLAYGSAEGIDINVLNSLVMIERQFLDVKNVDFLFFLKSSSKNCVFKDSTNKFYYEYIRKLFKRNWCEIDNTEFHPSDTDYVYNKIMEIIKNERN